MAVSAQQRSIWGSPTAAPTVVETMLDFTSPHDVAPQNEHSPMSNLNEAFARPLGAPVELEIIFEVE